MRGKACDHFARGFGPVECSVVSAQTDHAGACPTQLMISRRSSSTPAWNSGSAVRSNESCQSPTGAACSSGLQASAPRRVLAIPPASVVAVPPIRALPRGRVRVIGTGEMVLMLDSRTATCEVVTLSMLAGKSKARRVSVMARPVAVRSGLFSA